MPPRILGPSEFFTGESFGDILQQGANIKRARFEQTGREAQRQGFQDELGGGSLSEAFASQFRQQRNIENIKEVDEAFTLAGKVADEFGKEGGNEFFRQAFKESRGLQSLFSTAPTVDSHVPDGLTNITGTLNSDVPDPESGTVFKKGSQATIVTRGGQLVSVLPIGPQARPAGRGTGDGIKPGDISGLLDEQTARILQPYEGVIDETTGKETDPIVILQQRATQGNQRAIKDLADVKDLIRAGDRVTRELVEGRVEGAFPERVDAKSPDIPSLSLSPSDRTRRSITDLPRIQPVGITSSPEAGSTSLGREDALAEARRRGLVR